MIIIILNFEMLFKRHSLYSNNGSNGHCVTTHPIKHYTHSKFKVISDLINMTIKH